MTLCPQFANFQSLLTKLLDAHPLSADEARDVEEAYETFYVEAVSKKVIQTSPLVS